MNKRFLLFATALLAIGGLAAWMILRYANSDTKFSAISDDEMTRHMAKMLGPAPGAQPAPAVLDMKRPVRLAIGSLGFADEETNRKTADLTLAELTGAKGLELVERQSLDRALQEMNLSLSGLIRARDAVRVGKLVRADWFLLGSSFNFNGTNSIVVRAVDARTGILREGGVFASGQSPMRLASDLAGFIRRCRQNAAEAKSPVYLAVGSFDDLSVNNRQATFPTQLRSYLTAAYQKTSITLLEREFASTLLQEVRLDLAGLTDVADTNAPAMQSAYWMVDGYYQSYETSQFEVELVLNVRRMFGRNQQIALRNKPGELLFQQVRAFIDGVMKRDQAALSPTRVTELRAQLAVGRDILMSVKLSNRGQFSDWIGYTGNLSASDLARNRRNIEEAIRAFETVMLLDPRNREAKMGLAGCYKSAFINRVDEARDLYREIIEGSVSDKWTRDAEEELVWGFRRFYSPEEKRRWFESAAQRASNVASLEFYQNQLKAANEEVILEKRGTSEAERVAEERLFRDMQAWEKQVRGHMFGVDFYNTGLGKYVEAFGTNHAAAAKRLVELLPKLQAASSNLAPHILAGVVTFQLDTNAPIISEFERSLDRDSENPREMFESRYYIQLLASPVYRWAAEKKLYSIAAKTKALLIHAAGKNPGLSVGNEDKMGLAFSYLGAQEWQKALEVFQGYSNRPVLMGNGGLWGKAFTPVLTRKEVAYCQKKLGLPVASDPREFEMGDACFCLHEPSVFATTPDGLWICIGDQLMQLDFDLKTNFTIRLPIEGSTAITRLCPGSTNIWIGTAGEGLIEIDKATRQCRRLTVKDGLMMDYITELHLAKDTLWIGYGHGPSGGLGRLDVSTRRIVSYTRSLLDKPNLQGRSDNGHLIGSRELPPGKLVFGITTSPNGEIWVLGHGAGLRRYKPQDETWETIEKVGGGCLVADSERIFLGQDRSQLDYDGRLNATCELGVHVMDLMNGQLRKFGEVEGLPCSAVTTMTLDGQNLWIGGTGFIACVDAGEGKVRNLAYVNTRGAVLNGVQQIQIGGGYVWANFDKHLHRASLKDVR
ncbi:MAG: hypothetical protein HY298_26605 [Verrucomicrobia bacterium]|nr:hypothetical protein [Verrucomicrobiota bacterium]